MAQINTETKRAFNKRRNKKRNNNKRDKRKKKKLYTFHSYFFEGDINSFQSIIIAVNEVREKKLPS